MNAVQKKSGYQVPQMDVIEIELSHGVLEGSPGSGGNEGVIPGVDD